MRYPTGEQWGRAQGLVTASARSGAEEGLKGSRWELFYEGFSALGCALNDRASCGGLALLIGSAATASKPTSRSRWRHLLGTSPCPLAGPSPLPPGATKMGLILWLFLWIFWGLQGTFPGDIPRVPPPRPRGVHILGTRGVGDVPGVPRTEATLMVRGAIFYLFYLKTIPPRPRKHK